MTEKETFNPEGIRFDAAVTAVEALREKLIDALIPGYQAELDPEEAERAGAFVEDALSEQEAAESGLDLVTDDERRANRWPGASKPSTSRWRNSSSRN